MCHYGSYIQTCECVIMALRDDIHTDEVNL